MTAGSDEQLVPCEVQDQKLAFAQHRAEAARVTIDLAGLDWIVPDFSTLCRRQKTPNVKLPYRGGGGPLNIIIDSNGIEPEGEGAWSTRKHSSKPERQTVEAHDRRCHCSERGGYEGALTAAEAASRAR